MVQAALVQSSRRKAICAIVAVSVLAVPIALSNLNLHGGEFLEGDSAASRETQSEGEEVWVDGGQPWPQSGRTPSRIANITDHSPTGGAGSGDPADSESLMSIVEPSLNWAFGSYSIGTDSLATPVADLSY